MRLREVWPDFDNTIECVSILAVQLGNNVNLYNYVLNAGMVRHDKSANS